MKEVQRTMLWIAAVVLALGALVHLAIPLGGPQWYAFFGAPPRLVALAETGALRPWLTCVAIAALLGGVAAYAFSALGRLRRLPALRVVLGLTGVVLLARGLLFVPLAHWRPELLASLCGDCGRVNAFLLTTSALCVLAGAGLLAGAMASAPGAASTPTSAAPWRFPRSPLD